MMTERELDEILIERIQAGDQKAFDLLVVKYRRRIIRLAFQFVNNNEDAEDIAQDTFAKASRYVGGFRNDCAFYTWLYHIALNTARSFLVTESRRIPSTRNTKEEYVKLSSDWHDSCTVSTPESTLVDKELRDTINIAMDCLPRDLRAIIDLRDSYQLSYGEIAELIGCPIGTVRSRIFRSRQMILKKVKFLLNLGRASS